ncbi:MAG: hypothetical protein OER22_11710 [Gammaproteobacteria bacterium]|nr:hypothetical protein [Gammaproteobacteria bacterium]MDH3553272.1 hypothetical protein [Gammaproteobacteria bacterium]
MSEKSAISVHWSFWIIGAVGLIFNFFGCMNYISQMNAEMVASMPDEYRAIVESRPAWGTAAFAIAVFGGALGCLLLLLRKSVAVYVFIAALVGAVMAQIPFLGMADLPVAAWIGWLSQLGVGAFLIWYSNWSKGKGWISQDQLVN